MASSAGAAFSSSTSSPRHPLQRLPSPTLRGLSPVLHLLSLASFAASFQYLSLNPTPINTSYGWHFQYLTILGLALASTTMLLGLLADLTSSPALFRAKNTLSICTTPLEVLVSVLYWTLRAVDRDLVMPKWAQMGLGADLSFHAVPSVALVADLVLLSPPWGVSARGALALSAALAVGYWFWVERCFARNGFYPYPIFGMVGVEGRVGLFVLSAVVMTGSTEVLKRVYGVVNGGRGKGKVANGRVKVS